MSLGALVVSLSANTAQFTSAMDKAAYTAAQRMDQMKKSATAAGKAIGVAFVAGVGVASVLVKQAINSADAMQKMSQKAGVSVEALSTLAFAAELSGSNVESLQAAMVKLAKGMGDASMGTGEAMKGFDALGISVKDSAGNLKSSDAMMSEVAAKFATMENGANKTALAVAIFGRSGADLIPMLNSGADGLKAMQDEARAMGLELDTRTSKAAELFNDNLSRIAGSARGLTNNLMTEMIPALVQVSEFMVRLSKDATAMNVATEVMRKGIGAAVTIFQTLAVVGSDVGFVFKMTGQEIGAWAAQVAALASGDLKGFHAISSAVKDDAARARAELDKFQAQVMAIGRPTYIDPRILGPVGSIAEQAAQFEKKISAPMMVAAKKAGQAREKIVKDVKETVDAVQTMLASLSTEGITSGKNEEQMSRYRLLIAGATKDQIEHHDVLWEIINAKREEQKVTEEGARLMEETRTPLEQYATRITKLNELVQAGAIGWEVYDRAVKMAQDNLDKTTKVGEDSMAELQKSVEGWGKQFTDTFVDGVMKGKLSFKDLANSIIADILRIIVQKQVLNAIGGFGEGGNAGTGMIGMAMSLFGGGKASGGPVKPGISYLVGERGVETFTPSTPGTITPAASGAPVTVHQYFTVGDVASISMVRQAVAGSERRIAAGIGRSMSYGGALS